MSSRAQGAITVADPTTGLPLANAAIVFYDDNAGATPISQPLYAANIGGASTTTHTTNAKGQLTRYAQYAQRAWYTINGEAVYWPVDFLVDDADIFAMGPDGVTVTRAYRAVARMRADALEGKLRDRGGRVAVVDAYADGVTINDAQAVPLEGTTIGTTIVGGDCSAAVAAAVADLVSWGGGTLEFGPGTYFYPTGITWADNIVLRGSGRKTTLLHRPNSATLLNLHGYDNVGICDLTIDGNWEYNLDFNYVSSEVWLDGTDVFLWNCTLKNFNSFGVQIIGTRPVVAYNRILGPNDGAGAASYADLNVYQHRYAGRDGVFTPLGASPTTGVLVLGNSITGLRVAGIFVGGSKGTMILQNRVENCQRGWGPTATSNFPSYDRTGGGQIGISPTYGGSTVDFTIADNFVGPSSAPDGITYASGIELNTCSNGLVENNVIYGCPVWGISLDTTERIAVRGGSIRGCGTASAAGATGGLRVATNTSKFVIEGVIFSGNVGTDAGSGNKVYAINLSGTTNHYALLGCYFEGNTLNLVNTATGTNRKLQGNVAYDGDVIPEITSMAGATTYAAQYVNTSATGYGVYIQAGDDGNQYVIRARPYDNSRIIYELYGTGESLQRSAVTAGVARIDVAQASAGAYKHLLAQRNTATIWALGSDAADGFVVWDSTLANANFKVSNAAGNVTIRGQTIMPVGAAATPAFVFSGTATGLFTNGGSDLDFATAGVNTLRLTSAGLLDFRSAVAPIALGGGATATLGTIGGTGPATAAQNSWLQIKVGGTASFLGVWR